MKTKILLLLTILFVCKVSSQQKLQFNYDGSGNQVLRDWVCLNCSSIEQEDPIKIDSIQSISEASEDATDKFSLVAYPNPVTDILQVNWIQNPKQQPEKMALYSIDNRQLANYQITKNNGSQNIGFNSFPAGIYVLMVIFQDGNTQVIKIIKR